jgi:hypothetical protein
VGHAVRVDEADGDVVLEAVQLAKILVIPELERAVRAHGRGRGDQLDALWDMREVGCRAEAAGDEGNEGCEDHDGCLCMGRVVIAGVQDHVLKYMRTCTNGGPLMPTFTPKALHIAGKKRL